MKKFRMIDLKERNAREELIEYTFQELKMYFEPEKELEECWNEWNKIEDLWDLEEYLKFEAEGMAVNYKFEEIEVEDEKMVKYEIKKGIVEVAYKDRLEIKEGITIDYSNYDQEPEIIGSFDSLEEAEKELSKYESCISPYGHYYLVEEYYIEEVEYAYDEDFEEYRQECSNGTHSFSNFKIELTEKPSYNVLGIYDNMEDAEDALNDYEGDEEVFLSFS